MDPDSTDKMDSSRMWTDQLCIYIKCCNIINSGIYPTVNDVMAFYCTKLRPCGVNDQSEQMKKLSKNFLQAALAVHICLKTNIVRSPNVWPGLL